MKTASIVLRSAIAVCFAFVMSSASCDLFDKVDDVTIEIELDHTFNVNETADGQNVVYALKQELDAADVNDDFNKYKDKIQSVTVTSVTYEVQNCNAEGVTFTNGTIGFSAVGAAAATQVANVAFENICAAENQVKTLTYSQAAVDQLSSLLKNDKKANIYLNGTLSKTPAQFDVVVTVKATIVADAL